MQPALSSGSLDIQINFKNWEKVKHFCLMLFLVSFLANFPLFEAGTKKCDRTT